MDSSISAASLAAPALEWLHRAGAAAPLALKVWAAPGPAQATVVIAPAMGVGQQYYAPFAQWLASQGFHVLSFDYSGMGASRQGPLAEQDSDIDGWVKDYEAVVAHAQGIASDLPLLLLGHSLGGQLPGLFTEPERIKGMVAVAAGTGHWRSNVQPLRSLLFWYAIVPWTLWRHGCFPGEAWRMVGDVPGPAMRQWRRWCLQPLYSAASPEARQSYAQVRFPIHSLGVRDDELLGPHTVTQLLALYTNAPQQLCWLSPGEHGLKHIGHFGFFREAMRVPLWPLATQALRACLGGEASTAPLGAQSP